MGEIINIIWVDKGGKIWDMFNIYVMCYYNRNIYL